jgi:hypothetical protein
MAVEVRRQMRLSLPFLLKAPAPCPTLHPGNMYSADTGDHPRASPRFGDQKNCTLVLLWGSAVGKGWALGLGWREVGGEGLWVL